MCLGEHSVGRVRAPDIPLLLALQLQRSLPLAQGLTFTTAPLLPPGKGQDPGGPAVLSEPLLQQPPPAPPCWESQGRGAAFLPQAWTGPYKG